MDAIILAAGQGIRMGPGFQCPKGFIEVGGNTLIEQSLTILKYFGINRILIITGYQHQFYGQLVSSQNNLDLIFNQEFNHSGSLYSWYLAKNWVKEDFLLLESDILYAEEAIPSILGLSKRNAVLVSGFTHSQDEVYVEARNNNLVRMNKNKEKLAKITGEFVGISKFSNDLFEEITNKFHMKLNQLKLGNYEIEGFDLIASIHPIFCLKMPDLRWCEIDTHTQLKNAIELHPIIRHSSTIFC